MNLKKLTLNVLLLKDRSSLSNIFIKKFSKNIILPGGSTLIQIIKNIKDIKIKKFFLLTDERLNFNSIKNLNSSNLKRLDKNKYFKIIMNKKFNSNQDIKKYFIKQFDGLNFSKSTLLYGMGIDGHICSLFNSKYKTKKYFIITRKKKEKFKRISISQNFIMKFDKKYLFVLGAKKAITFNDILINRIQSPIKILFKKELNIICNKSFLKKIKSFRNNFKLKINYI